MATEDSGIKSQQRQNVQALLDAGGASCVFAPNTKILSSVSMVSTPATGSCAVQLTLKDQNGSPLTYSVAGLLYVSNSAGTAIAGATSVATLTNGAIQELVTGKVDLFIASSAGLLGFTLTAATGSYYASLVLPNGQIITTAAIVCN